MLIAGTGIKLYLVRTFKSATLWSPLGVSETKSGDALSSTFMSTWFYPPLKFYYVFLWVPGGRLHHKLNSPRLLKSTSPRLGAV